MNSSSATSAPEGGIWHAPQIHHPSDDRALAKIHQRRRQQIGRDGRLGRARDLHGLALVAEVREDLDQFLKKEIARRQKEVEENQYLEHAGNRPLGRAEHA